MRKHEKKNLTKKLGDSPINYASDLFIVVMVVSWVIGLILMGIFAIYATVKLADTSIWSDFGILVAVPLSAGGAIWMIKNSVQHAIMNKQGKKCTPDFPKVVDEIFESETPMDDTVEEDPVNEEVMEDLIITDATSGEEIHENEGVAG